MNKQLRLTRAELLARLNQLDAEEAEKTKNTKKSIDAVMTALWRYRAARAAIQWCLILAIVPLFLMLGMLSPIGPGWRVVLSEFAYGPQFLAWTLGWLVAAKFFDGIK